MVPAVMQLAVKPSPVPNTCQSHGPSASVPLAILKPWAHIWIAVPPGTVGFPELSIGTDAQMSPFSKLVWR